MMVIRSFQGELGVREELMPKGLNEKKSNITTANVSFNWRMVDRFYLSIFYI